MKFCWCTVQVRDLEESIAFYQDIIGLEQTRRFRGQTGEIAFMGSGETQIELIYTDGDVMIGNDISLGFEVDSLDEHMAFIKQKGYMIHSGPFSPNPNIRFIYMIDPNGLKIQFVEKR